MKKSVNLNKKIVFTKLQNQVYGKGLECMIECTTWKFYRTISGDYYKSSEVTVYKLKREECLEMWHSKIFHIKPNGNIIKLNCNGQVCSSEETVVEPWFRNSWRWGEYSEEVKFSSKILPRLIIAKGLNGHIFGTDCIPTYIACNLPKSSIAWDESVMMKCPFRPLVIKETARMVTKANNQQIILMSNYTKWVMKSISIEDACGYELL